MKLNLYCFTNKNCPDDYVFVFSTLDNIEDVRKFQDRWDHGGMGYENYIACMNGDCRKITSSEGLSDEMLDTIPYCTDEFVDCEELGGDYLDVEFSVLEYLNDIMVL